MMRQRDFWSVLAGQLTGVVLAHRELEIGNLVLAAVPLPTAATERAGLRKGPGKTAFRR